MKSKKGVMNQVIGVFILVLVVSILAGMTFLFSAQLKAQVLANAAAGSATNIAGGINSTAYQAVNDTETAGMSIIDYLPLLFLALIFGAVLVVVLRVILPYINMGNQMNVGF